MTPVSKPRLRDTDPKGRVDVALLRAGEKIANHVGAKKLWDGGLGDVVEKLIENTGLSKPITASDVARAVGILPQRRRNALR